MKPSKSLIYLLIGLCPVLSLYCGTEPLNQAPSGPDNNGVVTTQEGSITVQACGTRDTLPSASDQDIAALVKGNTDFACDMYKKLSAAGNTFFSPYSISIALAMTWAGARTETEAQMASALHFTLDQTKLHPAFDGLDLALKARANNDGFDLNIVNQLWGEKTYYFLPDFLKTLSVNYGAALRLLDFINNPEPSRVTINAWVSGQTNGRIQDLIPSGEITPATTLVLTNAIYFNAQWADTFQKEMSMNQTFYRNNDTVSAPFMHQEATFRYAASADFDALELPYKGNELSMLFILPAAGKMASVASSLTADFIAGLSGSLAAQKVIVAIPKFKFATPSLSIRDILVSLGMADAFSPGVADFSGIDGTRSLSIYDVLHKAFVAVDERGTEAAAATAVIVVGTSIEMPPPVQFTANRPFIFLIRDNVSGAVLFMGRLEDPVIN
ncbi:MAG TPA: serpin family protein [Chitinivibrionales bacterium]|nr:serpin family protein [Chitinivibrionales bacterium]